MSISLANLERGFEVTSFDEEFKRAKEKIESRKLDSAYDQIHAVDPADDPNDGCDDCSYDSKSEAPEPNTAMLRVNPNTGEIMLIGGDARILSWIHLISAYHDSRRSMSACLTAKQKLMNMMGDQSRSSADDPCRI